MSSREYVKMQIDLLPDNAVERVIEFMAFQMFSLGMYDNDDDYLASVPGMTASIMEGMATPLSECLDSVDRLVYQVLPNTENLVDEAGKPYDGIAKILRMWTHYE